MRGEFRQQGGLFSTSTPRAGFRRTTRCARAGAGSGSLEGSERQQKAFLDEVAQQRFAEKVAGDAIVVLLVRLRA